MITYNRTVHFKDTDAGGVVFFANILAMCHEAYEYALGESEFNLKVFFSNTNSYAVPIVHASVDFFNPIFCGDRLTINLEPQTLNEYSFQINYKITKSTTTLCQALTHHVCIDTINRTKLLMPTELKHWLYIYEIHG